MRSEAWGDGQKPSFSHIIYITAVGASYKFNIYSRMTHRAKFKVVTREPFFPFQTACDATFAMGGGHPRLVPGSDQAGDITVAMLP